MILIMDFVLNKFQKEIVNNMTEEEAIINPKKACKEALKHNPDMYASDLC